MIGGWSAKRGKFAGFVFFTMSELGHPPFKAIATSFVMAPGMMVDGKVIAAPREQILADIDERGWDHVAAYILKAQRPTARKEPGRPVVIGGEGELTVLRTRRRVTHETVVRWPDKVGDGPDERGARVG